MALTLGKQVFCAGLQSTRVIGHMFCAGFTAHSWHRTDNLRRFTKHARYQTYVQYLSIDNTSLVCDIEAGSDGSGAGGSAIGQEKPDWWGNPKRPATLWSVAYRLGHKLPRPPMT
jgi:hypothetical protein